MIRFEAIERGIAATTAGNDQFPQIQLGKTANERMPLQDKNSFLDQSDRLRSSLRIALDQEIVQSIEIVKSAVGVDQTRQDFAFGRFAGLPPIRFRR